MPNFTVTDVEKVMLDFQRQGKHFTEYDVTKEVGSRKGAVTIYHTEVKGQVRQLFADGILPTYKRTVTKDGDLPVNLYHPANEIPKDLNASPVDRLLGAAMDAGKRVLDGLVTTLSSL